MVVSEAWMYCTASSNGKKIVSFQLTGGAQERLMEMCVRSVKVAAR